MLRYVRYYTIMFKQNYGAGRRSGRPALLRTTALANVQQGIASNTRAPPNIRITFDSACVHRLCPYSDKHPFGANYNSTDGPPRIALYRAPRKSPERSTITHYPWDGKYRLLIFRVYGIRSRAVPLPLLSVGFHSLELYSIIRRAYITVSYFKMAMPFYIVLI